MRGRAGLLLALVMVVSGFLTFSNDSAFACSCVSNMPTEHMKSATAIFAGEVTEKKGIENNDQQIKFKAEQAWKGVSGAEVTVTNHFIGECGGQYFEVDKRYLVYAYGELGDLVVGSCTRAVAIGDAQADIDILGPIYVPTDKDTDLVYVADSDIGPLPAIFGMGAAVAAVIAFLTLRRQS